MNSLKLMFKTISVGIGGYWSELDRGDFLFALLYNVKNIKTKAMEKRIAFRMLMNEVPAWARGKKT